MCSVIAINGPPFLTAAANVFLSPACCTKAGSLQIRADFAIDLSTLIITLELNALPSINAMYFSAYPYPATHFSNLFF